MKKKVKNTKRIKKMYLPTNLHVNLTKIKGIRVLTNSTIDKGLNNIFVNIVKNIASMNLKIYKHMYSYTVNLHAKLYVNLWNHFGHINKKL